jgi:hypothetical protein
MPLMLLWLTNIQDLERKKMEESKNNSQNSQPKELTPGEESKKIAKALAPILIARLKRKGIHPNNSKKTPKK